MKRICVIGAGTMGAGIAQVFITGGYEVILKDIKEEFVERGISKIKVELQKLVDKGKMEESTKENILSRLTGTTEIDLIKDCDLVIEVAVEDIEIKRSIFEELDRICKPETIFASNTSSLSITEIATATSRVDRFIGMHFFNPAPVMKLVEIIRGMATSQETFESIKDLTDTIGKESIEVKEAPGFVVNRILIPMINEAIGVYAEGTASIEDIDKGMKYGANHPIGPLALGDLIGLDIVLAIMNVLYEETGDFKYKPHRLLQKYVSAGWLGRKSGKGFYKY